MEIMGNLLFDCAAAGAAAGKTWRVFPVPTGKRKKLLIKTRGLAAVLTRQRRKYHS
jgi:hypothetical protein